MAIWSAVCFLLAAIGLEIGDPIILFLFGGLGVWLAYLAATKKERLRKKNQAAAQKYQEDLITRSRLRFFNVPMVLQVLQELQDQNWSAIYTREGCEVRKDRIVTPTRVYLYIQYGLQNLDNQGLLELATYISSVCPLECRLATISHFRGGMSPSYSGHVSSDGSVSLVRDSWGDSVLDGYRVLKKEAPQTQPQGRAW